MAVLIWDHNTPLLHDMAPEPYGDGIFDFMVFDTLEVYRDFLKNCTLTQFTGFLGELRKFTPFADVAVNRMVTKKRAKELQKFEFRNDQGDLLSVPLAKDDEYPLSERQLEIVLTKNIDRNDNDMCDRVMHGVAAKEKRYPTAGREYLEHSEWIERGNGSWYNTNDSSTHSLESGVQAQLQADADLFECHDLACAYMKYKLQRAGSSANRDYDTLITTLSELSHSEERTMNVVLQLPPGVSPDQEAEIQTMLNNMQGKLP